MQTKLQKGVLVVLASLMALFGLGSMLNMVSAQTDPDLLEYDYGYDYGYDYDYTYDYPTEEAPAWVMVLTIVCWCLFAVFAIANIVVWIMSLVHCIQNAPADQKTLWIILILLVPFANWIYFFTKRKQWGTQPVKEVKEAKE